MPALGFNLSRRFIGRFIVNKGKLAFLREGNVPKIDALRDRQGANKSRVRRKLFLSLGYAGEKLGVGLFIAWRSVLFNNFRAVAEICDCERVLVFISSESYFIFMWNAGFHFECDV